MKKHKLTDEAIREAAKNFQDQMDCAFEGEVVPDAVRIAYEWLDAQEKTQRLTDRTRPLKHLIETWGCRYVSRNEVEIAAFLHPRIRGQYPHYNISSRLLVPSDNRLRNISLAGTEPKRILGWARSYWDMEGYCGIRNVAKGPQKKSHGCWVVK